jgi:hypothetical protein
MNSNPVVPMIPATDGFSLSLNNPKEKKTIRGVSNMKSVNE